jgi:hypothetical protein
MPGLELNVTGNILSPRGPNKSVEISCVGLQQRGAAEAYLFVTLASTPPIRLVSVSIGHIPEGSGMRIV